MSNTVDQLQVRQKFTKLIRHLGITMSVIAGSRVDTFESREQDALGATLQMRDSRSLYHSAIGGSRHRNQPYYKTLFGTKRLPNNDLGVWLGVTWHELGHVLWSPYHSAVPASLAFNLLEDARIESLLIGTYPNMKPALLAMLSYEIGVPNRTAGNATHLLFQYAWLAGRAHLPKETRLEARKLVNPKKARLIENIFAEYVGMGDNLIEAKALKLEAALSKLLGYQQYVSNQGDTCTGAQQGGGGEGQSGTVGDAPSEIASVAGEGEDDEATGTEATPELLKEPDQADDGDLDTEVLYKKGLEVSHKGEEIEKIIADLGAYLSDEVAEDASLQDEISKLKKVLNGAGSGVGRQAGTVIPPTSQASNLAREVKRIAAGFNDESAKGLVRKRDYGRLRPHRYEITDDLETAYDKWEPGLSQEMYVGLLVDVSGSMGGSPYNEIVYGLEQGLGDVATVDTVYFNGDYFVSPSKSSPTRMSSIRASGGTAPVGGMGHLYPRLLQSSAANRILVLFTDGSFNDTDEYVEMATYFDELNSRGIHVKVVGYGVSAIHALEKVNSYTDFDLDIVRVRSIGDLPSVVLGWTKTVLSKDPSYG